MVWPGGQRAGHWCVYEGTERTKSGFQDEREREGELKSVKMLRIVRELKIKDLETGR